MVEGSESGAGNGKTTVAAIILGALSAVPFVVAFALATKAFVLFRHTDERVLPTVFAVVAVMLTYVGARMVRGLVRMGDAARAKVGGAAPATKDAKDATDVAAVAEGVLE